MVPLTSLLATLSLAQGSRAQSCESARPDYGSAELTFHDSASGLARVHYALSGLHAPPAPSTLEEGVPDAAVVAARAADDALARFAELGYQRPLSDAPSPCADDGGSDALDVYLLHFSAADGQAERDHCEPGLPRRCAGFVLVENDFRNGGYASTAEGLRTVVPHEIFHLVQAAYDAELERWWAEGSAQWAAKQVYPELRDLERFLPAYFEVPWRPLNVPPPGVITNFLYATAIWPVFLHERFDADLVREVFEQLDGSVDTLPATDAALQARGSSLAQEFLQFAAYNAATGARASDAGYDSASDYPEVPLVELTSGTPTDTASGLGAYYYSLPAGPTEVRLDADPARIAGLLVPLRDGAPDLTASRPLPAPSDGDAIVVVAAQSLARTDAPFTLSTSPLSDAPGAEPSGCSVQAARGARSGSPWAALLLVLTRVARRRLAPPRKDRT
jgi:hypothetical protein